MAQRVFYHCNYESSWSVFSIPGNRICWSVKLQLLTVEEATQHKFRNSEWGSDTSDPVIKEVRDFLIPMGGTLGDLIDSSPRDTISRVFLEDKLFKTWNHGRTVLIGDACHKLLPSVGLGAVTAMQDAVVLANYLYEMKGLAFSDISATLDQFKNERYSKLVTSSLLSGGLGVTDMQDAVVLVNCLYEMIGIALADIQQIFDSFHEERYS
ncbi:hypothetical protein KI688_002381 [Linnemannia hyalina]|uniref:FAD-binding domain-containing protein n=1 Tax=Linnemannia hyalina TaxID=64524 RepID=A0A9P7XPP2_9FUNG|nr:hypothetical protein KI688_002381 [Linnemannia hyalina]